MLKTDNVPGLVAAWGTLTHTEQLGGGTKCEEPKQRGRAARQVLREGLPNEAMLEHPREQSCRSRKGAGPSCLWKDSQSTPLADPALCLYSLAL